MPRSVGLAVILARLDRRPRATAQELKAGAAAEVLTADDAMVIGGGIGPGQGQGSGGRAARVGRGDRGRPRRQGRPGRLRRPDDRARRPRPGRPADRAGDRHPVRPRPDQRDPHAPRPDDRHGPRLRARGGVHPAGRGQDRPGGREGRRPARAGRRSCSGSARSRRSARTAGCCSATGRSTGSAAHDDAVRPTGPFDPELPVLAFRRPDGGLEAVLFNHSTHTIGTQKPGRPLAVVLRAGRAGAREGAGRDVPLLRGGLGLDAQPRRAGARGDLPHPAGRRRRPRCGPATRPVDRVDAIRKEITVKVRHFDEDGGRPGRRRLLHEADQGPGRRPSPSIETFRAMRRQARAPAGGVAQDLGAGRPDRRRGDRGRPRRVLHGAGPGDQAALAVPLHVCLRAGQRLHRLHPRPARASTAAATRSGPACTASSSRGRASGSSPRPSTCWGGCTPRSANGRDRVDRPGAFAIPADNG